MTRRLLRCALAGLPLMLAILPAGAAAPTAPPPGKPAPMTTDKLVDAVSQAWFKAEWRSYAERFVSPEGRVIDNANGGISHSESQGYGLLLAARAGDGSGFDKIWAWTRQHLMVRPDGLAGWRWDPKTRTVTDTNNATDGDILIAWALWDASRRFAKPEYRDAAEHIAKAIGRETIRKAKGGPVIMPGQQGFAEGEQPDGPVVNLSYWVFPAFAALKELDPGTDWEGVRRHGLTILDASRFGPYGLPLDWESLAGDRPAAAKNFPAEFGYNAVRVPLYLALEGSEQSRRAMRRFAGPWSQGTIQTIGTGKAPFAIAPPLGAAGYNLVFAVARCATQGQVIPPEMIKTRSDLYYPETLRLLSVIALQERFSSCL